MNTTFENAPTQLVDVETADYASLNATARGSARIHRMIVHRNI